MSDNKRVFTVNKKKYAVVTPSSKLINEADRLRAKTVSEEIKAGTLLRRQLEDELRNRGMWNEDLERRYQELSKAVSDNEFQLAKGGISLKKAKELALDMRRKRREMVSMLSDRSELDSNTCEGRADAARFNFLFANSLVYEDTGERYFPNGLDDYLQNMNDPVALAGATEFFYLISNTEDVDSTLPENKFLKKYKFVNEDFRLVDSDGKLVDEAGRHIDENGHFIKWLDDGNYIKVDIEGRPLDDNDNFVVDDFQPFLDDDGNPVDEESFIEEEKPKKRTRKKNTAVEDNS